MPKYDDNTQSHLDLLMRVARSHPLYQSLMEYLGNRKAEPPVEVSNDLHGAYGQFASQYSNRSDKGKLSIEPQADLNTLVHELTHAAERQTMHQYYDNQSKQNDSPEAQQFNQGYEKLNKFNMNAVQSRLMDPKFTDDEYNRMYRTTGLELPAWAMGNMVEDDLQKPEVKGGRAPGHIDPTLATNFMILMDLANRQAKKGP